MKQLSRNLALVHSGLVASLTTVREIEAVLMLPSEPEPRLPGPLDVEQMAANSAEMVVDLLPRLERLLARLRT